MNAAIKQDLFRYVGSDCENLMVRVRYLWFTPGFQFIYFFRKASMARNVFTKLWWSVFHRLCMFKFGIQIPIGTSIGPGLRILHFGTIVVNPNAVIGRNFSIAQGCLIGNSQGKSKGTPTIGDEVIMGANSLIIGGIHIGNRVLIAPGAFVNFDVPDDSIVIGNPGRIIPKQNATKEYNVYLS